LKAKAIIVILVAACWGHQVLTRSTRVSYTHPLFAIGRQRPPYVLKLSQGQVVRQAYPERCL